MTVELAILLAVAVPFAGAVLIPLTGAKPNLRETVTLVCAALLFYLVSVIYPIVAAGGVPEVYLFEMLPGLSVFFLVEPLGLIFAGIASFLWIATSVYSIGYMRGHNEENQTRFYAYFAIALGAAMGVAFAGNMLTLFIFYEVLTLSTFPLVAHSGTDEAKRAGRVYLGVLLGTSIGFQLLAIIWTWSLTGTLDFTDGGILAGKADGLTAGILLALYTFGIGKAALMPFHRWLPAAMVAPTPVSALLHAVAVVKAGVFTVVKVVVYIFGIDFLFDIGVSEWLQYMAAATILIASLVAMTKDNLKARLAYSTVSQLSYVILGAMLVTDLGIIGSGMHIAMHAFGKITLFFCAGAFMVRRPQDRNQPDAWHRSRHALYDPGLFHRQPQRHRPAAHGWAMEQVVFGVGHVGDGKAVAARRADGQFASQRRLSFADPLQGILLQPRGKPATQVQPQP